MTTKKRDLPVAGISLDGLRKFSTVWLELVDQSVDWTCFDKYLRWLCTNPGNWSVHPPLLLFKALLLQHWFALIAIEFEFEMEDRRSFRRFVGLDENTPAPSHEDIGSFRRLLLARGIATEIFAELDRQLCAEIKPAMVENRLLQGQLTSLLHPTNLQLSEPPLDVQQGDVVPATPYLRPLGPPEWEKLEQRLLSYWHQKRAARAVPSLQDVKLTDLSDLEPHLTLIRVLANGGFRYELVGNQIVQANGGDATGSTIGEKAYNNHTNFGHAGLQGEMVVLFQSAVTHMRPAGTSAYFVNSAGKRCQIWGMAAPLKGRDNQISMLIGVALIKPILLN